MVELAQFPNDALAFRPSCKAGYWNAVRKGFAGCDNPAIQSVAPASIENWIEESPYRQKDRDNMRCCSSAYLVSYRANRPAPRYYRRTPALASLLSCIDESGVLGIQSTRFRR